MLVYWVTRIHLAQDRNQQWTPANTVMNFSSLDMSTLEDQTTTLSRNVGHIAQ